MALDYRYIRAYGKFLWSYPHTIETMVERARADKAPDNVICYDEKVGAWITVDDIRFNSVRQSIHTIAEKLHE